MNSPSPELVSGIEPLKISIITITYNSAKTVVDALESVASQSYRHIEHIVVDGGSTDATLALVERHGKHVARVVSEPDDGIYDAMNKGLAMASGDYVGFLNSDDILASRDAIAKVAAAARGASLVYGDLQYVKHDHPDRVVRRWRSGIFRPSRLRFGWMPPHPTFYARRSVLQSVGTFDTSLRIAADYDLMTRCLIHNGVTVAYVPEVLVRMRLGGVSNSSVAAMVDKSLEDLRVMRKHRLGSWFTLASKNLRKLPQFW